MNKTEREFQRNLKIFILVITLMLACFKANSAICKQESSNFKKLKEAALEVNHRDLVRELQFKKGTWKNPTPNRDPNLDMHKSTIDMRLL